MERRRAQSLAVASMLATALWVTVASAGSPAAPEVTHANAPTALDYVVLASVADGVGLLSLVANRQPVTPPAPALPSTDRPSPISHP